MMKFARENLAEIAREISPLILEHYKEVAHFQDIELDPDWERYFEADDKGILRAYTARTSQGDLVGYAIFFVNKNMHYRKSLQAVQDILFLKKNSRGTGGRLIDYADRELAKEGVQAVYHHVKNAHDFSALLVRKGYREVDKILVKRLDKG